MQTIYGLMICFAVTNPPGDSCKLMGGFSLFQTREACERQKAGAERTPTRDAHLECWSKDVPVWHPMTDEE